MALNILHIIAAAVTIVTGLVSLIAPRSVRGFSGLETPGPRGVTEVRAVLGGAFIGLGLAALIFRTTPTYQVLGIMYLTIAAARIAGIVVDKSAVRSNWISLGTEIVLGILLIL